MDRAKHFQDNLSPLSFQDFLVLNCFRVIAISIAFVTPDQQIVSFSLSPLHSPKAVYMYYEISMHYLIVILILYFLIGQINNNNNNNNLCLFAGAW